MTRPGYIGKYTRFRFKSGSQPVRTDRCASVAGHEAAHLPDVLSWRPG